MTYIVRIPSGGIDGDRSAYRLSEDNLFCIYQDRMRLDMIQCRLRTSGRETSITGRCISWINRAYLGIDPHSLFRRGSLRETIASIG